ncbi:hypothetical protein AAHE18_03G119300 [Arachis hypogaea]|nr:Protein EPIDERMAL PATTERNING FACTOR [Arachis hypogaea]
MGKTSFCIAAILIFLLYVSIIISPGPISQSHSRTEPSYDKVVETKVFYHQQKRIAILETMVLAGSKLPDCSHACGSCSPCRLVMVTSCASIKEAEPCPLAYKCMCHDKSYPVP